MLTPGTRETDFVPYFSQDGELVYCSDIPGWMQMFKIQHEAEDWRLFIDSSEKCPPSQREQIDLYTVGHSAHMKEGYEN